MTSIARVLFVLTSHGAIGDTGRPTGFHAAETAHPWLALRRAGMDVDFTSPKGGRPPVTRYDPRDPVQTALFEDPDAANQLANTPTPDQVDASAYRGVYFTGGHGPMWDLRGHQGLEHIARTIYESGGVVAAMCHGPAALVDLRLSDGGYLVSGKRLTSFPDVHEETRGLSEVVPFALQRTLVEHGAIYSHAADGEAHVVVDGRLITGQNPASAPELGARLAELITAAAS